ncbi:MAG TPA: AmmeMemoRadiSam system protein A [Vicinamibacterales bacterium]|nr:AmmeMemoRadiSam system protein A [Vicinamibacterales bacterium]
MLTDGQRAALLRLARHAIAAHLAGRPLPAAGPDEALGDLRAGAFVTLRRGGELRGCIGAPEGGPPLGDTVVHCAIAAATEDPRFGPVTADELPHLEMEVSVLGPIEPVDDPHGIEIGRHGLMAEQGGRRGLLLPQVATEWAWDRETFLAQTCAKAGLRPDAWRHGARLSRFEAEVFDDRAGAAEPA